MPQYKHIVCIGLGLANTCLIRNLRQMGFQGQITVLEKNAHPDLSKRWCTWAPVPAVVEDIQTTKWDSWSMHLGEEGSMHTSPASAYTEIQSVDLWAQLMPILENDPKTTLHFNADFRSKSDLQRLALPTDVAVDLIIDSRPPKLSGQQYTQQFTGWSLETQHPIFDTTCAQLMHFIEAGDRIGFLYCLPYTPTHAFVEFTTFETGAFVPDDHFSELEQALLAVFQLKRSDYAIKSSEVGCLPMGKYSVPKTIPGHWPIGLRSGALRASSGYGLLKITQQAHLYAESIMAGRVIPQKARRRVDLSAALDCVFIRAIRDQPEFGKQCLMASMQNLNSQTFVHLMRGEVSLTAALKVVGAMPKFKFIKALVVANCGHG